MKHALTILLFCLGISVFGQDTIQPAKQFTIANKTHTNRDFLNRSQVDNSGNLILVGRTENDFTYNDLAVIKLDPNLNVLWQKHLSFDTTYSFDRIVQLLIDENDNVLLVAKSIYAKWAETLFMVKLDSNGNQLWELEFSELETSANGVHPEWILANFNSSGNIDLGYLELGLGSPSDFVSYEITPNGEIINKNRYPDLLDGGAEPTVGFIYGGGDYYAITREYIEEAPNNEYNLIRVSKEGVTRSIISFFTEDQLDYIIRSDNQELIFQENGTLVWFLAYNFSWTNGQQRGYSAHVLSTTGELINQVPFDDTKDKFPIGIQQDNSGNLMVISNDRDRGTEDPLHITLKKYSPGGNLLLDSFHNQNIYGYTSFFPDGKVSVFTEFGQIIVFDQEFNFIEQIQLHPVDALAYNPTNIHFIGNSGYLTGTLLNSMYVGSDFYGQMDFSVKKLEQSTETIEYVYSGLGTSKTWINWVRKQSNGQYLVHITDKLGPDNPSLGGSRSAEYSSNYYFDSELNQVDVQPGVNRVDWVKPSTNGFSSFLLDDFRYQYSLDEETRTFTLRKDGIEQWSRVWEDNFGSFYDLVVNSAGDLVFRVGELNGRNNKVVVLSLTGEFNSIQYNGTLNFLRVLDNNWIFTHTNRKFLIYSRDLELISEKESYQSESYTNQNYSPSIQMGNRVLVSRSSVLATNYDLHDTRVYDQYGNLEKILVMQGGLRPRYSFLDDDDLVVLTDDGNQLEHGFSWSVAVLNKFENFIGGTLPDYDLEDFDGDGVVNALDYCEDTPAGNPVDEKGCNLYSVSDQNFAIQTTGESCLDRNDGSITVVAIEDLDYSVTLSRDGSTIDSKEFVGQISFSDLPGGIYQLCFKVDQIAEFERCFELDIEKIEALYVESELADNKQSIELNLNGADHYIIQVNDKEFSTSESRIRLDLEDPYSEITVKTDKSCQGVFEKVVISNAKKVAYPNPTQGVFRVNVGENSADLIPYTLYSTAGVIVKQGDLRKEYGQLSLDIADLANGHYYFVIEENQIKTPFSILKR